MISQDRRQNDNEASEVGEALSLSPAEGERVGICLSSAAIWDGRPLRLGALPPSTGSALDGIANSDSGRRSSCACKIRPAVLVGCVWFPLTLALSRREREHRIPRCNESRRSGLANTRRAILPLPKGEGQGEGEATLETPVRLRIADELNDTGTVRSAIQGRDTRTTQRVRCATQRRAILPLPKGEGRGEGEKSRPRLTGSMRDPSTPPLTLSISPWKGERECTAEVSCILRTR
jgi:hypothetical protein